MASRPLFSPYIFCKHPTCLCSLFSLSLHPRLGPGFRPYSLFIAKLSRFVVCHRLNGHWRAFRLARANDTSLPCLPARSLLNLCVPGVRCRLIPFSRRLRGPSVLKLLDELPMSGGAIRCSSCPTITGGAKQVDRSSSNCATDHAGTYVSVADLQTITFIFEVSPVTGIESCGTD